MLLLKFCVIGVLTSVSWAARVLYTDQATNGFGEQFLPNIPPGGDGNIVSREVPNLNNGFAYFGNQDLNKIFVHFNGFITFDEATRARFFGLCQVAPNSGLDLLPVYWARYDFGSVFFLRHIDEDGKRRLSDESIARMATDLNDTFTNPNLFVTVRPEILASQIKDVVLVTWENMYARVNTLTSQFRRHTFQAAIIKVVQEEKTFWFVQYYYAQLGSNGNWDPFNTNADQDCGRAEMGVSVRSNGVITNGQGVYSLFFPIRMIAECITNEFDYTDLGSWVFDITDNTVTNQPVPPSGVCRGEFNLNNDPKCFLKAYSQKKRSADRKRTTELPKPTGTGSPSSPKPSVTTEPDIDPRVQRLANKFCMSRDAGLYPLPIICDVFVSCSTGGVATPLVCPEGTNFNPEFLTCDHKENFECYYENATISGITNVVPPKPNHSNLCHYLGWGQYVHPKSCNKFYACTNSRSVAMNCPRGLHFKPTSKSTGHCDWPRNVKCTGDGVRPPPNFPPDNTPKPTTTKRYRR